MSFAMASNPFPEDDLHVATRTECQFQLYGSDLAPSTSLKPVHKTTQRFEISEKPRYFGWLDPGARGDPKTSSGDRHQEEISWKVSFLDHRLRPVSGLKSHL